MPKITVEGEGSFELPEGKKLVLGIEDAGIDILHRCGGQAKCTTCRVVVLEGDPPPMGEVEHARLSEEEDWTGNYRLSCQMRPSSPLTVRVINRAHLKGIEPGPRPED